MKRKMPKNRNPIAAALRSPHLKPQTVPDKKTTYSRKGRQSQDWRPSCFWFLLALRSHEASLNLDTQVRYEPEAT